MLYFFLFAVLLIPVHIRLSANTENEALKIRADITLPFKLKIKIYSVTVTVKKVIASIFSRKKRKVNRVQIFNIVKKHSKIKSLYVKSRIGTGDAASTAMISGGVLGLVAPFKTKRNYVIDILPVFEQSVFEFSGKIILKTNLLNTIFVIIRTYGGRLKWKNILSRT